MRSSDALDVNTRLWLQAAATHVPGEPDEALQTIQEWDGDRLTRALRSVNDLRWTTELNADLERAALLHADISLLSRHTGRPPPLEGGVGGGVAAKVQDGRRVGSQPLDPHIEFGRKVLNALRPEDAQEMSARAHQWYRTVAADFAIRHWLADLLPHLDAARQALPRDAGIRFDSGCLSEVLASAQVQAGRPQAARPSVLSGLPPSAELPQAVFLVSINLADAEKQYRSALQLDPRLDEARVRLARVLAQRGRHRDAINLLKSRADSADPIVQYYAALTFGDALERNEQLAEARAAYQTALQHFPTAQTPLIAVARLSRELADPVGTQDALAQLAALPDDDQRRYDPWWQYYDCNGRNAERETQALWQMFKAEKRP